LGLTVVEISYSEGDMMNISLVYGLLVSLVVGFAVSAGLNLLLSAAGLGIIGVKTSPAAFVVLSLVVAACYFVWGLELVALGWRGILLFFGRRFSETGEGLSEGYQWTPRPFMTVQAIDCRGDIIPLEDLSPGVFTSDHIRAVFRGTLPYQVADPYVFAGVKEGKAIELLNGRLKASIRDTIKGYTLDGLLAISKIDLTKETNETFEKNLRDAAGIGGAGWGLNCGELQIQGVVVLDPKIVTALASMTREKLEGDAEQIQSEMRCKQAEQYAKLPRHAVVAALVDAEKPGAKINQINIEGLGEVGAGLTSIGGTLTKLIEKFGGGK
jgi:regulator of protease activity HflC (stomatin/prohibitin superfamily)